MNSAKGTVSMWAKFDTFNNVTWPSLFGMRNGGDSFEVFELNEVLNFRYGDGENKTSYIVDFNTNEWHFFTFTWDNLSAAKIYVDGVLRSSANGAWTAMTFGMS